jgi:hypothetical protein
LPWTATHRAFTGDLVSSIRPTTDTDPRSSAAGSAWTWALAVVGIAACAWLAFARGGGSDGKEPSPKELPQVAEPKAEAPKPKAPPAEVTAPPPKVLSVESVKPDAINDPEQQKGKLKLPDGTYIEPLNGAINPPVANWEKGRPWSPIVGKETIDWTGIGPLTFYVHADGTKTLTMMIDTTRSGVRGREAVTIVTHPLPDGTPAPKPFFGDPALDSTEGAALRGRLKPPATGGQ